MQTKLSSSLDLTRHTLNYIAHFTSGATSVSTNDGKWHHICVTWDNTAGSWNIYKDGKIAAAAKGLRAGTFSGITRQ